MTETMTVYSLAPRLFGCSSVTLEHCRRGNLEEGKEIIINLDINGSLNTIHLLRDKERMLITNYCAWR
jgi:hypothetical protein